MANVKFLTGTETNLLKKENGVYKNPITEGCLYVTAEKVGTEWKSALYYDTATQRIKVGGDGKAGFDAMGNNIAETYIRDISMEGTKYASTDGATLTYTKGNGATTTILLPLASDTKAGVINTAAQTFAGDKTFKGQVRIQGGTDTSGASANSGYLLIGSPTGAHMSLDANEIQVKAASGTTAQLYINNDGGTTQFGGVVQPKSDNAYNLGGEQLRWKNIYGTTIYGTSIYGSNIYGNVTGNLTGIASNATDADKLDGYHRSDLFTSIPTWMNATGLTKTVTVEGDADKYYPVRITLSTSKEFPQLISIWKNLGSKTPSSYSGNHSNGTSSLWLRYEARSNTWDENGGYCKTWYKYQGYATLVAHAQMAGNGVGDLIVWLRGGGCEYKISCSGTFTATVYLTETNLGNSSYPVNVGPKTSVDNGGIIESHLGYGRVTNADKADVALKDEANRSIRTHYLSNMSFDGTTNKTTKVVAKLLNGDGGVKATIDFPTASASQAGAITTGTQTLTGAKTLDGSGSLTIQKASGFNYSGIGSGSDNTNRKIWFSHSSNAGTPVLSDKFLYNPASTDSMTTVVNRVTDKTGSAYGKLTVDLLEGIAAKAYADDRGNKISDKYVASMVFSATGSEVTLKYRTIAGADLASITVPNASTSQAGAITTGTQSIAGNKTFTGRIYINNTSDGALATADSGALVIGNKSSEHLIIDSNEIMAKATGTTANTLNIQIDGGTTSFGGNITPKTNNSSSMNVGTSSLRWQTLYGYIFDAATKFTAGGGNFSANSSGQGYLSSSLGLRVNPDTAYALKVQGNTFLNGIAYFANGTVYKIDNTGHAYLASLAVGEDSTAYKLYVGGTAYIKGDTTHAGNIYLQKNGQIFGIGSKSTTSLIRVVDNTADANGNGISIGGGGLVVIGAGESASNFVSTTGKSGGDENLHLLADSAIYLESYADTVGNRMGISINTAGAIIPVKASSGVANSQTVGNSSHYFNSMYSRWFHANAGKTGSDGGYGLYGGEATYSIAMRQTSNSGKHAYVQGDWATYFNMNSSTDRGWVFRSGTTPVVSISTGGYIAGNRLSLNRSGSVDYGRIYWYSPTYYTWVDYAASSGDGTAPTGGKPSSSTEVTSWALRSLMENASGYGWIWEASDNASKSTTTSPTMRMSLSSNTGRLRLEGNGASTTTKTGQFIVSTEKNGSNGVAAIELWRGTASSWQIANDSGVFYIRNNYYSSAAQTTYSVKGLAIDHSTGAASLPYLALGQDARNTSYRLYVVGGQSYFGQNIVLAAGAKITQHQASTSNSTTAIQWYKGGTSQNTYNPQISQHNTGGDGSGTITILPYATATEPWGGAVGLFIQKGAMSLDGKRVITSNNSGGTVGSATKFIYSDAGVLKETSSTVGANTKFMYMSSGTMTASTASVGSGIKIMYLSSGTFTASTSNVGTATQPMYMYGGELKACNSTVGSTTRPVYMNAGTISQISYYIQANIKSYSNSLATGGWKALNGKADSPSVAIAQNNNKADWNSEKYSSSLVFGCSDTRGLLDIGYSTPKITFGGSSFSAATDDNPKWYMSIYGTSTKSYNLDKMPLAETANKWTTARSISLVGGVRGSCTIDGSANKEIVVTPSFASTRSTSSASGYHLITINSNNAWMTAFTIRLYQSYRYTDIVISGYNYNTNYWHRPSAVILGSSESGSIDVKFGYTAAYALWVAVPAGNYYGVDIINVTNGHNAFDSLKDLFSISNVSTLPGTTQTTITANRPWYRGETISVANGGTGVNSQTANRLVWSTSATALSAANHYVNASKLGVATTSEPSYNFYVNGTAYITSSLQTGGNITAPRFVGLADRATFIDATAVTGTASYLTTHPAVAGRMAFYYNFNPCDGLFPTTNNANFVITFNKHSGSYDSQLGFSSNGNIYYRSFNNSALNTTTAWRKVLTSSDITGDLDSRYVNITGDTLTGSPALKFPASAGSVSTSDPMSITYGRIATYSTLYINANTDNSGTEYIILTAGKGLSNNGGDGLAIGSSTLKWLGYDVLTTNNYSSTLDSRYVNTSGDTMTGALNFKNGTWNKVGDDAQFGDNNTSGSFAIQGLNGNTNLKMVTYNGTTYGTITWNGTNFVFSNKISGTVTNAEKDSAGNTINSTYISTIKQITSNGTTFTFRGRAANGSDRSDLITIPAATTSVAGLITNAAQDLKGDKTLDGTFYGKANYHRFTAGMAIYRTQMPSGTSKPVGWYRIAKIENLENYANFILFITGGWSTGAPSNAQISISIQNNTVKIRQISGIAGLISQVRVVGSQSNGMYLEVYQNYNYSSGGTMSTQRFYLFGSVKATVYEPTTNDGSGTAIGTCTLKSYDNTYVNSGTANRLPFYSSTLDLSSSSHFANSTQIGINSTSSNGRNFYVGGTSEFNGATYFTPGTANCLMWLGSSKEINSGYHYADSAKVAINYTAKPSETFYVSGTSRFTDTVILNSENKIAINFRPGLADYYTTISYQTSGNEALVFATKNTVTSFMFVNGEDSHTKIAADRWNNITPGLQIKQNCVYIGSLLKSGTAPTNKLYVDGGSMTYALRTKGFNRMTPASDRKIPWADSANLRIGTTKGILHISTNAKDSGSAVTDGYEASITFGTGDTAYAGIYSPTSGGYGNHMIFATTGSYANGAYARMIITAGGSVGIGTLSPAKKLHVAGSAKVTDRLFMTNWIEFTDSTGLYSPNSGAGTHFQPNVTSSYGSYKVQGAKGGYTGFLLGPDKNYFHIMTNGTNEGLYNESKGRWILHYNRTNDNVSIGSSTSRSGYMLNVAGNLYVEGTTRLVGTITYDKETANRVMWTDGNKNIKAANHYANDTRIAINYTSDPGYNFYVSGTSRFSGIARFNTTVYFANGETYFVNGSGDSRLRYLGVGNVSYSSSYAINIGGNAFITGIHYFGNGTTYYINNEGNARFKYTGVGTAAPSSSYALNIGGNAFITGTHYFGNSTGYYINNSGTALLNAITAKSSLTANSSTKTPFTTNGNLYFVNKKVTWNTNSYVQHVILLAPVPTSSNWSGMNYFDGKFLCWKTGGNMYDVVEVNFNCVYNTLRYNLQAYGDYGSSWKLCIVTYNSIKYYALNCPYHANPYTNVEFTGHISSSGLTGGTGTVDLPLDVAYYNENSQSVLNSEVKNSLTNTLTAGGITSTSATSLWSIGGFSGSLSGNASSATKLQTARTIRTNLASTSTASFDGTANITPGVTGVLPTGNGGTGSSSFTSGTLIYASSATQLSSNTTLKTGSGFISATLGSTSTAYLQVTNNNGACDIRVTTNRGLYDVTNGKWMIYMQKSDNTLNTGSTLYVQGSVNASEASYVRRTSAGGGYHLFGNSVQYARSYISTIGTTSAVGEMYAMFGNSTASGTANNARGSLFIYGTSSGYSRIMCGTNNTTNYTLYLPGATGQLVYHTNDTAVGGSTTPVYINSAGQAVACTSYTSALDGRYVNVDGDTMTGTLTIGSSSQTTVPGVGIKVHDLRNCSITPKSFGDQSVNFYFDQINDSFAGGSATNRWMGIMHMKGWTGDYAGWQLAGDAESSYANDTLRYRAGSGTSWGAWQSVITDLNYSTYLDSKYAPLNGNRPTVTFTDGSGNNTSGYRLIGSVSLGTWSNYRQIWAISSRHTGNGILTINFGNNSNNTASPSNSYCEINYFGNNVGGDVKAWDSFLAYMNGSTIYFFWRYYDYNPCYVTVLNSSYGGGFTPTNGTWMTSISSTYGSLKAKVSSRIEKYGDAILWYQGRDSALSRIITYEGYNSIYSIKSKNGDWSCGVYNEDTLFWTYFTDTNYNNKNNTPTAQMSITSAGYLSAPRVYNAVWNDYAEFRKANSDEPGRVVIEGKFGEMRKSTKRLQPGGSIISDTYGHAMGETKECKTPVAVAGRVLAYTYEDANSYEIGDVVCTGPNGTVSKMTREEIKEWPDRIIGIVSEIPNYDTWGQENVKVNGRIWIKIK